MALALALTLTYANLCGHREKLRQLQLPGARGGDGGSGEELQMALNQV